MRKEDARQALWVVAEEIYKPEDPVERQLATLEDRARGDGKLAVAELAPPKVAYDRLGIRVLAPRGADPLDWPDGITSAALTRTDRRASIVGPAQGFQ